MTRRFSRYAQRPRSEAFLNLAAEDARLCRQIFGQGRSASCQVRITRKRGYDWGDRPIATSSRRFVTAYIVVRAWRNWYHIVKGSAIALTPRAAMASARRQNGSERPFWSAISFPRLASPKAITMLTSAREPRDVGFIGPTHSSRSPCLSTPVKALTSAGTGSMGGYIGLIQRNY
jgi:hypothetical protein